MAIRKAGTGSKKSSTAIAPKKNSQDQTQSDTEAIAQRAWEIWDRSGRPEGHETANWLQAEKELKRS